MHVNESRSFIHSFIHLLHFTSHRMLHVVCKNVICDTYAMYFLCMSFSSTLIFNPCLYLFLFLQDGGGSLEKGVYKRVAVVEYFFDIIYRVHVETEAKNGKHAGQKRTYRAVSGQPIIYHLILSITLH